MRFEGDSGKFSAVLKPPFAHMGVETNHAVPDQRRFVVVLRKVYKIDGLSGTLETALEQEPTCLFVGKVTSLPCDPSLKIQWIRPAAKHLLVIVRLKEQDIRSACSLQHRGRIDSCVSHNYERI